MNTQKWFWDHLENDFWGAGPPIEISPDGTVLYRPPPSDDVWLDKSERHAKQIELEKERAYNRDCWKLNNDEIENEPLLTSPIDTSPPPAPNR